MLSEYKYHGYLKSLPGPPDPAALAAIEKVVFAAEDMQHWKTNDDSAEKEWKDVPARVRFGEGAVSLIGHFEDIRRIDNLDRNVPCYWAPLTAASEDDPRFPLDCHRYPVVEIVYRCTSSRAYPACQWHYPGGAHLCHLEPSREWRTASLLLSSRGFPSAVSRFTLRLYSAWRSTESMEVAELRFRALLPEEQRALSLLETRLEATSPPRRYSILNDVLPFGVTMNAAAAQQLADLLDISFFDYWRLALEDIARHHHNCIVLEDMQAMSHDDRGVLLDLAENFGLRLIPTFQWPMDRFDAEGAALIDAYIKPHVDSNAVLAWNILDAPPEEAFDAFLKARDMIAEADPNHPLAVHMRQADAFPLYAPYFAAAGFSHFKSNASLTLGEAIRAHRGLIGGQQFWITAPTYVYASDAPDWNTSPQARLMLNLAMANGARGWMSHTYHNMPVWVDGHYQRSLTGPFLTFSDLWAELGSRVERLSVLAPLLLSAHPIAPPDHLRLEAAARKHIKSRLNGNTETISVYWLQGPNYYLFYVVNHDTDQVSSVNLTVPESLPDGLEVYDTTALVRTRAWLPSEHSRHIEMFPGQGQLFLLAEPPVCEHWRDIIAQRILLADQRQARVDLELARQYRLDVAEIDKTINAVDNQSPVAALSRVHTARENLFNIIYATPSIYETRQLLVKASSIICGCDEALSLLHGRGRAEAAHELGIKIVPLARTLTTLRVKLRRGAGAAIRDDAATLVRQGSDMLSDIWNTD